MFRTTMARTAVTGAAVSLSVLGALAVGMGDPVRPTSPAPACDGSAGVHCAAGHIIWNGTGLLPSPDPQP